MFPNNPRLIGTIISKFGNYIPAILKRSSMPGVLNRMFECAKQDVSMQGRTRRYLAPARSCAGGANKLRPIGCAEVDFLTSVSKSTFLASCQSDFTDDACLLNKEGIGEHGDQHDARMHMSRPPAGASFYHRHFLASLGRFGAFFGRCKESRTFHSFIKRDISEIPRSLPEHNSQSHFT